MPTQKSLSNRFLFPATRQHRNTSFSHPQTRYNGLTTQKSWGEQNKKATNKKRTTTSFSHLQRPVREKRGVVLDGGRVLRLLLGPQVRGLRHGRRELRELHLQIRALGARRAAWLGPKVRSGDLGGGGLVGFQFEPNHD